MRLSEERWVDGKRRRLEFTVIAATCCLAATVLRRATGIVDSVHRSTAFDVRPPRVPSHHPPGIPTPSDCGIHSSSPHLPTSATRPLCARRQWYSASRLSPVVRWCYRACNGCKNRFPDSPKLRAARGNSCLPDFQSGRFGRGHQSGNGAKGALSLGVSGSHLRPDRLWRRGRGREHGNTHAWRRYYRSRRHTHAQRPHR